MTPSIAAVKPAVERETLLEGIKDAFKLLNKAGDVPPWTPKLMDEFAIKKFGLKANELEPVPLRELLKILSLRLDDLKKGSGPSVKQQEWPYCDCGVASVRVEGIFAKGKKNAGKPWAAFMCVNKVKEHEPVWIDLAAEYTETEWQIESDPEEEETADF